MNIELRLDDTHSNLYLYDNGIEVGRIPFDDAFECSGKLILENEGVQVFIVENTRLIESFDTKLYESYGIKETETLYTDVGAASVQKITNVG